MALDSSNQQPSNPPARQRSWTPPTEAEIARMAEVTPADIADAIRDLRQKYPELAREWGLSDERARRAEKRAR